MKVLLDECVPRKFKDNLVGHQFSTVQDEGLSGTTNGELLLAAEHLGFELFITIDQGFEYQQSLANRMVAILVLRAKSGRLLDLLPLVSKCLAQMQSIGPGDLVVIAS